MSNNKQSSLYWLIMQAVNWSRNTNSGNDIIEFPKGAIKEAKAMHQEEIQLAFESGKLDAAIHIFNATESKDSEQYYNETYGGNK